MKLKISREVGRAVKGISLISVSEVRDIPITKKLFKKTTKNPH